MIWAKEETLPRAEIEKIQLEKLKQTVHYIYERVEPYRRKMEDAGVKPEDIQSLDDLKKLPFTYKADFRDNYPMGLFAVDKKDLVRFHASSGTTSSPRSPGARTSPVLGSITSGINQSSLMCIPCRASHSPATPGPHSSLIP